MMLGLLNKTWSTDRFVGNGYSMPIAWPGWAVIVLGVAAMLVSVALIHGPMRGWAVLGIPAAVWTIHIKRAHSQNRPTKNPIEHSSAPSGACARQCRPLRCQPWTAQLY